MVEASYSRPRGLVVTLLAGILVSVAWCDSDPVPNVRVGIGAARQMADNVVLPSYPAASVTAGHTGVAVVELHIHGAGKVTFAHTLEAPDPAIAASVEHSVEQWSFHPFRAPGAKEGKAVYTRLVFYFRIVDHKPVLVDAAAEMLAARSKPPEPRAELLGSIGTEHLLEPPATPPGSTSRGIRNYSFAEILKMSSEQPVQVIDPGERGQAPPPKGVLVMPISEIPFRAPFELNKRTLNVVDCSNMPLDHCEVALDRLQELGFRVATVGAGAG